MQKKVKLITGSNGEIGQTLINQFNSNDIITLDIEKSNNDNQYDHFVGSILDNDILNKIHSKYEIIEVYHLAAVLSTKAEKKPDLAKEVNINGTENLLKICLKQFKRYQKIISFFFPSSIAVYNMLNHDKNKFVHEQQYCDFYHTVYGKSKLTCERIGTRINDQKEGIDFRCIRFPGIISATSIPTGGTSDYAGEMIHSAALNKPYACFVNSSTILPFIVMPDAISAIIQLMNAPKKQLKSASYNITSFSLRIEELTNEIKKHFPDFTLKFEVNLDRQNIVNSWPRKLDDSLARNDWGWSPKYNLSDSFKKYIIPNLLKHYDKKKNI